MLSEPASPHGEQLLGGTSRQPAGTAQGAAARRCDMKAISCSTRRIAIKPPRPPLGVPARPEGAAEGDTKPPIPAGFDPKFPHGPGGAVPGAAVGAAVGVSPPLPSARPSRRVRASPRPFKPSPAPSLPPPPSALRANGSARRGKAGECEPLAAPPAAPYKGRAPRMRAARRRGAGAASGRGCGSGSCGGSGGEERAAGGRPGGGG